MSRTSQRNGRSGVRSCDIQRWSPSRESAGSPSLLDSEAVGGKPVAVTTGDAPPFASGALTSMSQNKRSSTSRSPFSSGDSAAASSMGLPATLARSCGSACFGSLPGFLLALLLSTCLTGFFAGFFGEARGAPILGFAGGFWATCLPAEPLTWASATLGTSMARPNSAPKTRPCPSMRIGEGFARMTRRVNFGWVGVGAMKGRAPRSAAQERQRFRPRSEAIPAHDAGRDGRARLG